MCLKIQEKLLAWSSSLTCCFSPVSLPNVPPPAANHLWSVWDAPPCRAQMSAAGVVHYLRSSFVRSLLGISWFPLFCFEFSCNSRLSQTAARQLRCDTWMTECENRSTSSWQWGNISERLWRDNNHLFPLMKPGVLNTTAEKKLASLTSWQDGSITLFKSSDQAFLPTWT